ncbi:hypothetical protein SASPL_106618 [Salvia splendens]|uniref:Ribosome-recycling factor, chloroplastic n=1 Tax=Salvia splendens TaxID=180675 RepID=A0A8X8YST4_SALSN|nr:hypothetical protein SASPL_106618 [Salvia splendens]
MFSLLFQVEYYGTPVVLKSIAQISTPDASSILVQPYDKSSLKSIEKAIVNSDLGMTPNNDGDVISIRQEKGWFPELEELSKVVAKQAEEGKVAIRNIRRDAIKSYEKLEKEKKLSEDNVKDLSADLQKVTDEYMKKIESIFKQKEKHLFSPVRRGCHALVDRAAASMKASLQRVNEIRSCNEILRSSFHLVLVARKIWYMLPTSILVPINRIS